jgi:hypothetical protein
MAGALTISTLNNDTGVLATQNGMTGIAKAWVNFNGTGTVAIRDSFNVSSITDLGTGSYAINFATAMPNANYGTYVTSGFTAGAGGTVGVANFSRQADATVAPTTSAVTISTINSNSQVAVDTVYVSVAVLSS